MSPGVSEEYTEFRRQQILTAAWRSFAEKGIRGTTIRGIAKSLGLSTGVVYTYFTSKEEIVAALQEMSLQQNQGMLEGLADRESVKEAVDSLFDFLVDGCSEEDFRTGARANLISWSEALADEAFRVGIDTAFHQLRRGLADIVAKGIDRGELSWRLEPEPFAELILALVFGIQVQAALLKGQDPRSALEAARELLQAHLRSRSA